MQMQKYSIAVSFAITCRTTAITNCEEYVPYPRFVTGNKDIWIMLEFRK